MKRVLFTICIVCVLAGGAVSVKAGDQDFTLRNRTGYAIAEVYVSPAKDKHWGEDVMGRDILPNGKDVEITFSRRESTCKWDLKVVFDDDDEEAVWENFDLCTIEEITLRYEGKRPTATWK